MSVIDHKVISVHEFSVACPEGGLQQQFNDKISFGMWLEVSKSKINL